MIKGMLQSLALYLILQNKPQPSDKSLHLHIYTYDATG